MTGTGPLRPAIESAIEAAAFPTGQFHLVGEVPDLMPYLSTYDVLILPSVLDGRPVVVLEALAMGVPVIASKVGALTELIEDGVNGFLCEPGDTKAFADRLEMLTRSPARLAGMKAAAREFAERHLDARMKLAAYESAFAALVDTAQLREGMNGQAHRSAEASSANGLSKGPTVNSGPFDPRDGLAALPSTGVWPAEAAPLKL